MSLPNEGVDASLEARVEQLFSVVPLHLGKNATWEGLPEHLIVTTGIDTDQGHEYIIVANWLTKDKASIVRPMLDFDKPDEWQSVFGDQTDDQPLFKARVMDILHRPYSFKVGGDQEVTVACTNFEIFAGRIGMWGDLCDSDESAAALAALGEDAYKLMTSEFLEVVELDHLLRVPELTPEAFLTD